MSEVVKAAPPNVRDKRICACAPEHQNHLFLGRLTALLCEYYEAFDKYDNKQVVLRRTCACKRFLALVVAANALMPQHQNANASLT